jgi:hypothetical protein
MIFKMIEEATTELYRMLINGPTGIGFDRIRNIRAFEYGSLTDDEIFNRILELSLKSMCVFDLTTLVCDDVILTSVETDVNVLRAASDICKLLIGGNQFVFRDTELDNQQEVQI